MKALKPERWLLLFCLCGAVSLSAQDREAQLPRLLKKAYARFETGSIHYPLSNEHLEPGYSAGSVHIPHLGFRISAGYRVSENFAGQISLMRPGPWMEYRDINGDGSKYSVWLTIGSASVNGRLPLNSKLSLRAEAGLAIVTRHGFGIDGQAVMKDISYADLLAGVALEYRLSRSWELSINSTYVPDNRNHKQPHAIFYSAGLAYRVHPLTEEKVVKNAAGKSRFPDHTIQVGASSNIAGYGPNRFFSSKVPIFWGGQVRVKKGFVVGYQRNVFHTRRWFSLNWGLNLGYWDTQQGTGFFSAAVFPMFRFWAWRMRALDAYVQYSVAGPALLSHRVIDGHDTGRLFTFQDLMGMGFLAGEKKNFNLEFMLGHFSNGNIFPRNAGVMMPLQLNLGYCWNSR
ncbi:MAG TPA: acyloxyacyl hydrolase [Chitinophagaceae bacterium]|nr:acyloxyacyl hydrolase [Chitinophagaceae bacterium]